VEVEQQRDGNNKPIKQPDPGGAGLAGARAADEPDNKSTIRQ
jgi:hypothetical protein